MCLFTNFHVINIGNIVIIIDNIVKPCCFLISLTFYCSLSVSGTDSVSFSTTFGELFLVYSLANTLVFWLLTPVSVGVGSEIGQICGVFSSKDSKNAHFFLTFLNGYIHPNNFKNKKTALGALPQTPLTCEAAGAGGKPYPPTPTVSVGSIPRRQG